MDNDSTRRELVVMAVLAFLSVATLLYAWNL